MNTYWANFAKTGSPNSEGLPNWPLYDDQNEGIIEFQADGTAVGKPNPKKDRLDLIRKAVTLKELKVNGI
jgi:para-nitrobenzyl esterase